MTQLLVDNLVIDILKKKIKNTYLKVHLLTGKIHLSVPHKINEHALRVFIDSKLEWIKHQLTKVEQKKQSAHNHQTNLPITHQQRETLHLTAIQLVKKWEPIIGVTVNEVRIRKMKTKWGTCNIHKHRVWLSLALAAKEPQCLEYVVVHEMVHLLERRHNQRFYAFMDSFLPNWRSAKKDLNQAQQ